MKTNFLVLAFAVLAVVLASAYIFIQAEEDEQTDRPDPSLSDAAASPDAASADQLSGRDTLASLMAQNETLECAFRFTDQDMYSEGTGFFSDGRMRIDAMGHTIGTQQYVTHLIIDGETMYSWGETDHGSFAVILPADQTSTGAGDEQLSTDMNVDYECRSWAPDNSVFAPPAGLDFTDISAMMNMSR